MYRLRCDHASAWILYRKDSCNSWHVWQTGWFLSWDVSALLPTGRYTSHRMHIPKYGRRSRWFSHRRVRIPVYYSTRIPIVRWKKPPDVHSPFRESVLHTAFWYHWLLLPSYKRPQGLMRSYFQPYNLCVPDLPIRGRNRFPYTCWLILPASLCWPTGTSDSAAERGSGMYPRNRYR